MFSASRKPRAYAPDPTVPSQGCDTPGCLHAGEYRAPKSRSTLREFHWFCLEHVRAYNASWDYYKGMSESEIEEQLRADTSWQRPSWPLGQGRQARLEEAIEAELHAFAFGTRPKPPPRPDTPPEVVKTKYKALAKQHHPDANNGDKCSEERLKTINLAYAALRGKLTSSPAPD
jgi:hypothetical protein